MGRKKEYTSIYGKVLPHLGEIKAALINGQPLAELEQQYGLKPGYFKQYGLRYPEIRKMFDEIESEKKAHEWEYLKRDLEIYELFNEANVNKITQAKFCRAVGMNYGEVLESLQRAREWMRFCTKYRNAVSTIRRYSRMEKPKTWHIRTRQHPQAYR